MCVYPSLYPAAGRLRQESVLRKGPFEGFAAPPKGDLKRGFQKHVTFA